MDREFSCGVCAGNNATLLVEARGFQVLRCETCRVAQLSPMPAPEELDACYGGEYWETPPPAVGKVGLQYSLRMRNALRELMNRLPSKARTLDVGCGDGSWVRMAGNAGLDSWGVDAYAASDDPKILKATIHEAPLEPASFDCVTFFHSIEHVRDPRAELGRALGLLKPGGILAVETPNADALAFAAFKARWQPLELPTHLHLFPPDGLTRLVRSLGPAEEIQISQFSLRASPGALAYSLFPGLQPRRLRSGRSRFGTLKLGASLMAQVLALPAALTLAALGRGCVFRAVYRKAGQRA